MFSALRIGTGTLIEASIDYVDGRKYFMKAKMTSVDGKTLYSDATALFIYALNNIARL